MTEHPTIEDRPAAGPEAAAGPVERVLARPLWQHTIGLALVLLALVPLLGRDHLFHADEGAAMAQARLLSDSRGWAFDHPLPALDPDGEAFPLHYAAPVERPPGEPAAAPFAKHPAYAVVLAAADRAAGVPGMVLTSAAGTLLAALAAALLARRLAAGLAVPALWATGLATPLFVDSWVVIAHTLGAALVAAMALGVLKVHQDGSRWPLLGIVAATAGAALLRNEAILLAGVLSVTTVGLAWRTRRPATALAGVAVLLGAVAGRLLDGILASSITGDAAAGFSAGVARTDFLAGRLIGAAITLIVPSYRSFGPSDIVTVLAVGLLVAMVVTARRRPEDTDGIRLFAVLAAAAAVTRAALAPEVTPGLLVAAPGITAGLVALRPAVGNDPVRRWLAATVGLFVLAVLATQYASGGSGEWGGRYFAVALPLLVPVLLLGLREVADGLDRRTRPVMIGALVVACLAFSVAGGRALRTTEDAIDGLAAHIEESRTTLEDPVVVATSGAAGRVAWAELLAGQDWLLVEPEDLPEWLGRLAAADRDVVLATRKPETDRGATAGWTITADAPVGGGSTWTVLTLTRR